MCGGSGLCQPGWRIDTQLSITSDTASCVRVLCPTSPPHLCHLLGPNCISRWAEDSWVEGLLPGCLGFSSLLQC